MSKITKNLYIGSYVEATNSQWLAFHGITHIVNMSTEHRNYFPQRFRYFRGDLYDHQMQSLEKTLKVGFLFIRNAIAQGGTVFVHCHAGVSRSSSMVLYYLMKTYGWSLDYAIAYMRRTHPRTNPNSGFMMELRRI